MAKSEWLEKMEVYDVFMRLKDETEAAEFWEAHIPDPLEKAYFTPCDYRWKTAAIRRSLFEAHHKKWDSFWGMLHWRQKEQDDATFSEKIRLVVKADVEAEIDHADALGRWLHNRYVLPSRKDLTADETIYLLPDVFDLSREEAAEEGEDWDAPNNLDLIGTYESQHGSKVLYYWKQVHPTGEDPADGRRHVILMDRTTHAEAALKPGQEPYTGK